MDSGDLMVRVETETSLTVEVIDNGWTVFAVRVVDDDEVD